MLAMAIITILLYSDAIYIPEINFDEDDYYESDDYDLWGSKKIYCYTISIIIEQRSFADWVYRWGWSDDVEYSMEMYCLIYNNFYKYNFVLKNYKWYFLLSI